MKQLFLSLSLVMIGCVAANAQHSNTGHKSRNARKKASTSAQTTTTASSATPVAASAAPAPQQDATKSTTLTTDNLAFATDSHDFGTLAEGGPADHVFQFKNTGKEPIVIQKVQASCGCTTPDWTKDPILPGKSGMVKASYGTQGRPGPFTKTLTVTSNAGIKVLTIKGNVEKAPTTSVPENGSMMRTN